MKSRIQNLTVVGMLMLIVVFCASGLTRRVYGESSEAEITRATAILLEHSQFSGSHFDSRLAGRFVDRYMDTLDGAHLLFFKSDKEDFEHLRKDLPDLTLRQGDTKPAHEIFARYLQRLTQQITYETNLLRTEKFTFTGNDTWAPNRQEAPFPTDLAEAQNLWREEVREDYLREELTGTPVADIATTLTHRYQRLLETVRRLDSDEILGIYLDSLAHVYDPHSDYFGREESENFDIEMNLSLVGIGATLQSKDGYCVISDLVPGGPAAKSGLLKAGDRIVAVGQSKGGFVDIMNMPLPRAVELIRGQKGTSVRLTVIPVGSGETTRKTITLMRDKINLADEHAKASIIDMPQSKGPPLRIGVIDLPSFYGLGENKDGGAAADMARLIAKLKKEGVHGIVLDLRGNGGGSLEEAVKIVGLFVPAGPVVQTRDLEGDVDVGISPEKTPLYTGPLILLTSKTSASASEIVAGALKDYGRALIVGDSSTFGKGTVQTILPLSRFFHHDWGELKVTIRKFYLPSGASTQLKGVTPEIVLPSLTDLPSIGESKLPNALPWDLMPPTTFKKSGMVAPVVNPLRDKSRARVDANAGFRLVREELAVIDKDQKQNALSLNEAVRRGEKKRSDEMETAMAKILREDAARMPPTYEVTLATIDTARLTPAPKVAVTNAPSAMIAASGVDFTQRKPDEDLQLLETENILVDYVRALAARPTGVTVAGTELHAH